MQVRNEAQLSAEQNKMQKMYQYQWIGFAIIFMGLFGYYWFGYDNDPETCYAASDQDRRIATKLNVVDVGKQFGQIFRVAFCAAAANLASGIVYAAFSNKTVRKVCRLSYTFATWLILFSVIIGIYFRYFTHGGKVCSGDYLEENESTDGYLISKGKMLSFLTFAWVVLMTLGVCIGLVAFFLHTS